MTINEFTHRKKPVEIAAKQFILGTTTKAEMMEFCPVANIGAHTDNDKDIRWFVIPTLEGDMEVRHLDYVIEGVEGEFYPCKPAIFEKTYEKIVPVVCMNCNEELTPDGRDWHSEGDKFWHDSCGALPKEKVQITLTHSGNVTRWSITDEEGEDIYQMSYAYPSREAALKDATDWVKTAGLELT